MAPGTAENHAVCSGGPGIRGGPAARLRARGRGGGAATATAGLVVAEGEHWDCGRVRRVDVDTTVLTLTMEAFSRPHVPGLVTPVNTNFSTRRTAALCL